MKRRRPLATALLLSGLLVGPFAGPARSQSPDELDGRVWRFELGDVAASSALEVQTPRVAGGGDVDGDGYADLALGRPGVGQVILVSGRKGTLLRAIPETPVGGLFGVQLRFAGDIDGDGADDLLIAAGEAEARSLVLVSGATGLTLDDFGGLVGVLGFDGLGDVDDDSVGDIAVALLSSGEGGDSEVQIRSGADGGLIRTLPAPPGGMPAEFGATLAGIDDLDGDLVPDLLVGSPGGHEVLPEPILAQGRVDAYSGRTGATIFSAYGPVVDARFGSGLAAGGDVDADGVPDALVYSLTQSFPEALVGTLHVLSGDSGTQSQSVAGALGFPGVDVTGTGYLPGRVLSGAIVGDVNGDGIPDIATAVALGLAEGQVGLRVHSGENVATLLRAFDFPAADIIAAAQVLDAGDVDGDGLGDLLFVTVSSAGGGETGSLKARLVFGGDPWEGRLGDRVEHITSVERRDAFFFEAAAGTRLRATAKRLKGGTLVPRLDVFGPLPLPFSLLGDDETTSKNLSSARLPKGLVLEETGRYRLEVIGAESGGPYRLSTGGRFKHAKGTVDAPAPGATPLCPLLSDCPRPGQKVLGSVAVGETTSVRYELPRDSLLSLSVRRGKGSLLSPQLGLIYEGAGDVVFVFPEGTELNAKSARLKKFPIPHTGNWRVEVIGANETSGDFVLKAKLKTLRGKARYKLPKPHQVEN